jgi:hypothetical protein
MFISDLRWLEIAAENPIHAASALSPVSRQNLEEATAMPLEGDSPGCTCRYNRMTPQSGRFRPESVPI